MHTDTIIDIKVLVCTVGKTVLCDDYNCLIDLHNMLLTRNDWMELGSKNEGKDTKPDTVEDWARNSDNPLVVIMVLRKV